MPAPRKNKIRESLYVKIAKKAIANFHEGSVPLSSTTVKEALAQGMNEKQSRRLVERVNTMAHQAARVKMSKAGECDRFVDFDIVDPNKVLDKLGNAEKTAKTAYTYETPSAPSDEGYPVYEKYASARSAAEGTYSYSATLGENAMPLPDERRALRESLSERSRPKTASAISMESVSVQEARYISDTLTKEAAIKLKHNLTSIHDEMSTRAAIDNARYEERVISMGRDLEKYSQVEVNSLFRDYHSNDSEEAAILETSLARNYKPFNYRIPEVTETEKRGHVTLRWDSRPHREFDRIKEARAKALDSLRGLSRLNTFLSSVKE